MYFERLIERIAPTLKRMSFRLTIGNHSYFSDEDLFQEALVHLWQDFQKGKLAHKTDKYIVEGCYFHIRNYLRKAGGQLQCIYDSGSIFSMYEKGKAYQSNVAAVREEPQDPVDSLNSKMLIELIQKEGVDKKEKAVLSLYAEGLTTRKIGSRLGVSHVWVVKILHRIRQKSRDYLDPS